MVSFAVHMSTREEMAARFVAAMLSNETMSKSMIDAKRNMNEESIRVFDCDILPKAFAISAVNYADALLEALSQPRH